MTPAQNITTHTATTEALEIVENMVENFGLKTQEEKEQFIKVYLMNALVTALGGEKVIEVLKHYESEMKNIRLTKKKRH